MRIYQNTCVKLVLLLIYWKYHKPPEIGGLALALAQKTSATSRSRSIVLGQETVPCRLQALQPKAGSHGTQRRSSLAYLTGEVSGQHPAVGSDEFPLKMGDFQGRTVDLPAVINWILLYNQPVTGVISSHL